jgi:tRNA1Val (adenine37-N6)-methyltransferase
MGKVTVDTFFDGRIRVKQDRTGYRFSIDAVLLAHHAAGQPGEKVLDLGTGCGIVALIMGYRRPEIAVWAVEVQRELAELARLNIADNRMQGRIVVLETDLKKLQPAITRGLVDLVVCNPPYRRRGSGRINPNRQRAVARHEIKINLREIIQVACRMLNAGGRFVIIYPAERLAEILTHMRDEGLEPKFMRTVHSYNQAEAKRVIITGTRQGRPGLKIASPLFVYDQNGDYTAEVQQMFKP